MKCGRKLGSSLLMGVLVARAASAQDATIDLDKENEAPAPKGKRGLESTKGQRVTLTTSNGKVTGKVLAIDRSAITLRRDDDSVVTVWRAHVSSVVVVDGAGESEIVLTRDPLTPLMSYWAEGGELVVIVNGEEARAPLRCAHAEALLALGSKLYVACGDEGAQVYDVSEATPRGLGHVGAVASCVVFGASVDHVTCHGVDGQVVANVDNRLPPSNAHSGTDRSWIPPKTDRSGTSKAWVAPVAVGGAIGTGVAVALVVLVVVGVGAVVAAFAALFGAIGHH